MAERTEGPERPLDVLIQEGKWLRSLVRGLVSASDADDVAQDLALHTLERGQAPRDPRGWLAGAARNLARMAHRGGDRRAARERDYGAARPSTAAETPPSVLERLELQREVSHAVRALPEPYRTTLLLRYLDEQSTADVAVRTGVSEAAVRVRIHRGLALLGARLDCHVPERRRKLLAWVGTSASIAPQPLLSGAAALVLTMKTNLLLAGAVALTVVLVVLLHGGALRPTEPAPLGYGPASGIDPVAGLVQSAPADAEGGARRAAAEAREPAEAHHTGAGLLRGRVVDPGGAPLAGATVLAVHDPEGWRASGRCVPQERTETDLDGEFEFAARPALVVVLRDGFQPTEATPTDQAPSAASAPASASLEVTLAPAARVFGRLLGRTGARTRVVAVGTRLDGEVLVRGPFDAADGAQYAIPGLATSGTYRIQVSPEDALTSWVEVALDGPGDHHHDIDLSGVAELSLHVLDELSEGPIVGARVATRTYTGLETVGLTDDMGRVTFRVRGAIARWRARSAEEPAPPPAFQMLELSAPGYSIGSAGVDRLLAAESPRAYLVPSARVEGRVLRADGSPAPGAVVEWFGSPLFVHGARTGIIGLPPGSESTTCTADGAFALADVFWDRPDAAVRVTDPASGLSRIAWDASPARPGEVVRTAIVLPPGPTIETSVTWAGLSAEAWVAEQDPGTWRDAPIPLPWTRVVAVAADGARMERVVQGDGSVALEGLALGRYAVHAEQAHDPSIRSREFHVALTAEAPCAWLPLSLQLPRRLLRGQVLAADGGPAGETFVMAFPDWALGPRFAKPSTTGGVTSDGEGRFKFSFLDLPVERSVLLVLHADLQLLYDVPSSGPATPRLPALRPVQLVIRTADGSAFLGPLLVSWHAASATPGGRFHRPRQPDAEGRLEFELPAGAVDLEVVAAGDAGLGEVTGLRGRARLGEVDGALEVVIAPY